VYKTLSVLAALTLSDDSVVARLSSGIHRLTCCDAFVVTIGNADKSTQSAQIFRYAPSRMPGMLDEA
jgi:hypothetical protein